GTIHRSAVQYVVQFSFTVSLWSALHAHIEKDFDTTRVPGFRLRIFGRSLGLMSGSRNIVRTVALERSVSKRSAFMNVAFSGTPASWALRFDSSTMFGLYSIPI